MSKKILTEILPNFYFVPGEQNGRFPYSNGLMLDTQLKVLVDAGFGLSRKEAIEASGQVDVIINTHFHIDHAYGNQFFPEAKIWAHVLDAPALRSPEVFKAYTGFSEERKFPDFPGGPPAQKIDRELSDGEVLDFGDYALQVIHTPGHTPGHISLYEPKAGILFSGDIDVSPFGPWYGNARSDLEDFTQSIKRLIKINPKILLTSHMDVITENVTEKLTDYVNKLERRDEKILENLSVPKTMEELLDLKIIYPRYPEPQKLYRYFEETMLEKHLRRLIQQGKVIVKAGRTYKAVA